MKLKSIILIITLLISISGINAQENAKSYYKDGSKEFKSGSFAASISNFTKAIQLDKNYTDAYFSRAKAYLEINQLEKAIEDFDVVNSLDPENIEAWLSNGESNFKLMNYFKASEKYERYLTVKTKDLEIYNRLISSLYAIQEWQKALKYAKLSLEVKALLSTYYSIGDIEFVLKNFSNAESAFRSVLAENPDHLNALLYLAKALYEQGRYDDAIREANKAIASANYNKDAFLILVYSNHKKLNYPQAIIDLSTIIDVNKEDDDILDLINYRGDLYFEFSQHMKAIADYTNVISQDSKNIYALYQRAKAYVEITRKDAAILDYSEIVNLSNIIKVDSDYYLNNAKSSLINLKKENNKPRIDILNDNFTDDELTVSLIQKEVNLKILVKDENSIEKISVEGGEIIDQSSNTEQAILPFNNDRSYEYLAKLDISNRDKITITAEDEFGNSAVKNIKIKRIEINTPDIIFDVPFVDKYNTIFLGNNSSVVSFEGNVKDESLIKSLTFNNVDIPFDVEEINPSFNTSVYLQDQSNLTVEIIDIYNNRLTNEYLLNRDSTIIDEVKPGIKAVINPMIKPILDKTWVVFIENSKYQSFDSKESAASDFLIMKSAFSNYKVDRTIHKQNMTKSQMDRFFSIELRDLIYSNNVNSLIVWYAGHGKFIDDVGYWIPIDATVGEEFSYFSTNNLKAHMQVYANDIDHSLVISDANLVGSSFYEPIQDLIIKSCSTENATKLKSSQLFSAEGPKLSTDNSVFTETFANILKDNKEQCISIEIIVGKVAEKVMSKNHTRPQFGRIPDFSIENGTFFFYKN